MVCDASRATERGFTVYFLYSLISLFVLVVLSPWFLYQAIRHKKYLGSLGQRLGYLPVSFNLDGDESIWLHAVSVGEVLAARPLVAELRHRYSNLKIFLSTTTMSGQQVARRDVRDIDGVFYFPFDWTFTARRTRDRVLRFFRMSPNRPVLVAGSTLRGEEELVIRAFNRVRSAGSPAMLIVAARHPERFGEVERLCRDEGLVTVRRSELAIDAEPR